MKNLINLLDASPEIEIIDSQIQIILEASRMRPISLEEVRIFEILIKCKKMIEEKDDKSLEAEFKKLQNLKEQIPTAELLKALDFKKQDKNEESEKDERTERKKSDQS